MHWSIMGTLLIACISGSTVDMRGINCTENGERLHEIQFASCTKNTASYTGSSFDRGMLLDSLNGYLISLSLSLSLSLLLLCICRGLKC